MLKTQEIPTTPKHIFNLCIHFTYILFLYLSQEDVDPLEEQNKLKSIYLEIDLLLNIQINIFINIHRLKPFLVKTKLNELLNLGSVIVSFKVSLVLGEDFRLRLLATQAVAERGIDDDFIKNGTVVEGDG